MVVNVVRSLVSHLNSSSSSSLLRFWSRNSFGTAVPGQGSQRFIMHLLLLGLQTVFLIRSLYVKSTSQPANNRTFWWELQTQTEWVIFEPARTHHLGLKVQNFENSIFTFGYFSLKAVYNSCKSQRLLQVAKFLFMYSFTHTDIVFLFRYLPTETVIFVKACYQTKCFIGYSFFLFWEQVLLTFRLIFWFQV